MASINKDARTWIFDFDPDTDIKRLNNWQTRFNGHTKDGKIKAKLIVWHSDICEPEGSCGKPTHITKDWEPDTITLKAINNSKTRVVEKAKYKPWLHKAQEGRAKWAAERTARLKKEREEQEDENS